MTSAQVEEKSERSNDPVEGQVTEPLKASQAYVHNLIDSSLDMIISVDKSRHIVEFNKAAQNTFGYRREEVIGKHVDILYADVLKSRQVYETTIIQGRCVQEILNKRKDGRTFPCFLSASILYDDQGHILGVMGVSRDITEQKKAEVALQQRNRELALLNRAGQAFTATLDLDCVLITVLDEVRHLFDVVATSVWLKDSITSELVCKHATGPQNEIVHGWRLAPDEGLVGWTARTGESLIVADTRLDQRHFKAVDQQTALHLLSILAVPLRVREGVIGVIEVGSTACDRFTPSDQALMESLAATAAIAIDNAQLYEQACRDAQTKEILLREVNHRVKNNLSAIVGVLYSEQLRTVANVPNGYQMVMRDVISRVQSLATVHSMLSLSEWKPIRLYDLATQVIHASMQALSGSKHVQVHVPFSPILVTSDQAHHLALIVNELTLNTLKYALQEREQADIAVQISAGPGSEAGPLTCPHVIQIEFRDDGPGYPPEMLQTKHSGMGFDLLRNMIHKNLHGTLAIHNDRGAVTTIQFPSGA